MKHLIWTQWNDLELPENVEHCKSDGIYPYDEDIPKIEFFVPSYMGGPGSIRDLSKFSSLRVIQSPNAGVDDLKPLRPAGVTLCNAAGVHDDSTAELAIGLAIASRRGFARFAHAQAEQRWDHVRMATLTDSTVAILGYGRIGARIAELLRPFKVTIDAYTNSGRDGTKPISAFDATISSYDIIILIMPLTDSSRGFMNASRLAAMKEGASLVNVARGAVVDSDALCAQLQAHRISAALDVTDPEPLPPGHPLWSAPNLIITPHVGGDSQAFVPRGRRLIEEQIARYARGEELINIIARD